MLKKLVLLSFCLVFVLSMLYSDEATIQRLRAQGQKEGWTFTVGQTSVSDIPLEQLCKLVIPADWRQRGVFEDDIYGKQVLATPPASYDLRSLGYMTSVKDQASCGSCWAFAHIGSYESAILWLGGPSTDLSEQFLIDCNTLGYTCANGGWLDAWPTFNNGVPTESCYPYTEDDGSCTSGCAKSYPLVSWAYVGSSSGVPSTASIKQAIYDHGAVACAVYANTTFQNYTSGIFNSCTSSSPNHAVVLAGWNDSSSYWIMKNSWGTGWGQSGYMYITYGCSNIGYAAAYGIPNVGTPPPVGDLAGAMDSTYTFSTSGSANWTPVTDVYYYDGDSAKSGTITHSQSTTMTTTIAPTQASNVKFYWKVSSEASYDYLSFYIDGALQGQISGTVDWTQVSYAVAAGSHTLTWTYSKDASVSSGSDCGWADKLEVVAGGGGTDPIAEALDVTGQTFSFSGTGNWYKETTTYYYGGDAAQSPVITHSQSTSFQTTITGKSSVKFYWRVSSESGYDYLRFYSNGTLMASISGSTSWAQKSYTATPSSTYVLKWTYSKDASVSSGSDCGWVDYLQLQ